jgi:salicylate hydroxylase
VKVGVVGAGIGGLTLAHGLKRRGVDVTVFDRDAGPEDTAGYRLHLPEAAFAALVAELPGSSILALRECGAGNEAFRQFAVLDHLGHTRLRLPIRHAGEVLMIGRRPLRAILARGLEDDIAWNSPVTDWTVSPDGVELADGTRFDLLVAADGANSRTARRWVGRATARRSGIVGIAGRALLPQRIPADLRDGPAFTIGPAGVGAFLSLHDRAGRDPAAEQPSVVWSVAAALDDTDTDLTAQVHHLTSSWSDDFHRLVDRSEPGSVAAFPFHFPAALRPWPSGPVTLLGDAVHPMPPTAGAGAGTAILDAAHLAGDLGTLPMPEALAAYRSRLLTYAPAAVDEARPALRWQRRLANPLLFTLAVRAGLPAVDAGMRLVRTARRW